MHSHLIVDQRVKLISNKDPISIASFLDKIQSLKNFLLLNYKTFANIGATYIKVTWKLSLFLKRTIQALFFSKTTQSSWLFWLRSSYWIVFILKYICFEIGQAFKPCDYKTLALIEMGILFEYSRKLFCVIQIEFYTTWCWANVAQTI